MALFAKRFAGKRHEDVRGRTLVWAADEALAPNATNVDIRKVPGVEIVQDLNEQHWTEIPSDTFDTIIAEHVIEHVRERLWFLDECRRVARPGATLILEVPHWKHIYAHSMLDHRWTFTHQSFDTMYVTKGKFEKLRVEYRLFTDRNLWTQNEKLGRTLAKHTGIISGLRFYLRVLKDPN